jgi:hypothetical protein
VFRLALARAPSDSERNVLLAGYERMLGAAFDTAHRLFGLAFIPRPDIVTYHHDPREDPDQLASPAAVVAGGIRLR